MRVLPIDPSEITRPYDPASRVRLGFADPAALRVVDLRQILAASEERRLTAKAARALAMAAKQLHAERKALGAEESKRRQAIRKKAWYEARREAAKQAREAERTEEQRLAAQRLADLIARQRDLARRGGTLRSSYAVLLEVAQAYGVTPEEICGPDRHYRCTHARQAVMWHLAFERPDKTYRAVAHVVGRIDHSTIVHGVNAHAERHGLPKPVRPSVIGQRRRVHP